MTNSFHRITFTSAASTGVFIINYVGTHCSLDAEGSSLQWLRQMETMAPSIAYLIAEQDNWMKERAFPHLISSSLAFPESCNLIPIRHHHSSPFSVSHTVTHMTISWWISNWVCAEYTKEYSKAFICILSMRPNCREFNTTDSSGEQILQGRIINLSLSKLCLKRYHFFSRNGCSLEVRGGVKNGNINFF